MTTSRQIDQRIFDLYDEYCHGGMERRECFSRAAAITVGGTSAFGADPAVMAAPRRDGQGKQPEPNATVCRRS